MIKFIKNPTGAGYAYSEGDVATLNAAIESELIELGFAEVVEEKHEIKEIETAEAKPIVEKAIKTKKK